MKASTVSENVLRLDQLKRGQEGIVAELATTNQSTLKKLMSMGILPGIEITLIQAYPTYVVQAGFTQVAIDKAIASVIHINEK